MEILAMAAKSKKIIIRNNSSSGGIFFELAQHILNQDGYVCGVVFEDDFKSVKHIISNNEIVIKKMQTSKYIPSKLNETLKEIEEISKKQKVLFTGTPCQVAALNKFVKNDNIITAELICHGVPNLKVYQAYVDYISQGRKIKSFNFRSKKISWERFGCEAIFEDGTSYFKDLKSDPFLIGFLEDGYLRDSCYNCQFANLPRNSGADLSLADYWGAPQEMYDDSGISLVLINTIKGKQVFNSLDVESKQIDIQQAIKRNKRIVDGKLTKPKKYKNFSKDFKTKSFKYIHKKYLRPSLRDRIRKMKRKIKNKLHS